MEITQRSGKPVIADVAKLAGVSVPTVSRVLTGKIRVSDPLRERVVAAIRELDYRPNGAARALVEGRQSMVAVVSSDTTRYGSATTIRGVERAAQENGFNVLIASINVSGGVEGAIDLVLGQPVSGIVVLEFDDLATQFLRRLPDTIPVVAVAGQDPTDYDKPRAFIDDFGASRKATSYLLSLGHRQVEYIGIPFSPPSGRIEGWKLAHREAGRVEPMPLTAGWEPTSVVPSIEHLLSGGHPTAILCGNDELAMGAIRALHDRGVSVPGDVSVMGIDGHPLGAVWIPALTTMALDFEQVGRDAFEVVVRNQEKSNDAQLATRPASLTIRESVAPPRA